MLMENGKIQTLGQMNDNFISNVIHCANVQMCNRSLLFCSTDSTQQFLFWCPWSYCHFCKHSSNAWNNTPNEQPSFSFVEFSMAHVLHTKKCGIWSLTKNICKRLENENIKQIVFCADRKRMSSRSKMLARETTKSKTTE